MFVGVLFSAILLGLCLTQTFYYFLRGPFFRLKRWTWSILCNCTGYPNDPWYYRWLVMNSRYQWVSCLNVPVRCPPLPFSIPSTWWWLRIQVGFNGLLPQWRIWCLAVYHYLVLNFKYDCLPKRLFFNLTSFQQTWRASVCYLVRSIIIPGRSHSLRGCIQVTSGKLWLLHEVGNWLKTVMVRSRLFLQ